MLYPPILASTQSVFSINEIPNGYEVKFSLAAITTYDEIGHIGILVAKQSNNRSIANTALYPDGVIYKSWDDRTQNSIIIASSDLNPTWEPGSLYKIQLRFGSATLPSGNPPWSNFAQWHKTQVEANAFSEWSTAMIVKPIHTPTLTIVKDSNVYTGSQTRAASLVASLTPTFFGVCEIPAVDKEVEESYKFEIFQGNTLLESSGWLSHVSGEEDAVYFKTLLENQETYQVTYDIRTNNGYQTTTDPFNFVAVRSTLGDLEDLSISAVEDQENGRVLLMLEATAGQLVTGNFVITRSSEASGFQLWEDIRYLNYFTEDFTPAKVCFIDYTIESGITYRYAIQGMNTKKVRTNPLYTQMVKVDFEYGYLSRDGVQLRLTFNQKMSSFKHSTLRTKQDTLGDKYPHLLQNGNAYYAEFPISGLITYQGNTQTFFEARNSGVYYKNELILDTNKFEARQAVRPQAPRSSADTINPNDYIYFDHWKSYPNAELDETSGEYENDYYPDNKDIDRFEDDYYKRNPGQTKPTRDPIVLPAGEYAEGVIDYTITTDLTDNNIFIERKFREKVEEFLNDFTCKLYRSPTEGNIVVNLMNISMTPNEQLGRMIYEFSATAYEVLDFTLPEMDKYGVINIGAFDTDVELDEVYHSFGQIDYWPGQESLSVFEKIAQQEEVEVGELYRYHLEDVQSFWIEPYPKDKIAALIAEKRAEEGDDGVPSYLTQFFAASEATPIRMTINDQSIYISPFKVYTLNDSEIITLTLQSSALPILVNYVADLTLQKNSTVQEITSIDITTNFGQIAGLFSEEESVLQEYNFNYSQITDLKIADSGLYSIYQSKDLVAIIKETMKKYIEETEGKTLTPQQDGSWKDQYGDEYYFNGIDSVTIEADKGTTIYIGESSSSYETFEIGKNRPIGSEEGKKIRFESNKIFFKDVLGHANYLQLKDSTFAIIDYTFLLEVRTVSNVEG